MSILESILEIASQKGLNQTELAKIAGIHPVSLSRALSSGNCRLSTVETLAHALGMRLVCVEDNSLAESLIKGEVF